MIRTYAKWLAMKLLHRSGYMPIVAVGLGAGIFAILATLPSPQRPVSASQDAIVVTGPMGVEWRVEGANALIKPMLLELKRMNRIEAAENAENFKGLPSDPEAY